MAVANPAPDQRPDDELIRRYVDANDRDALEALFRRHADMAYATALRICRNPADAHDAVQSAFVTVMRNAAAYRGGSPDAARVWITRIVIGTCKNRIRTEVRRRKWEERASGEQDTLCFPEDPSATDEDRAMTATIFQELNGLPNHYRLPILLHHCEGRSLKETAAALSVSENTLHMQLKRGLERLRVSLDARGAPASLATLTALLLLPALSAEAAPAPLLASLGGIAQGTGAFAKSALLPAAIPAAVKWAAVTLALVGAGMVGVIMLPQRQNRPSPPPSPPPPPPPIFHHWNFTSPGLPPEFKVIRGTVHHVANNGLDQTGCLLASNALIRVDVPVTNFPIRVSYKAALHVPRSTVDYVARGSVGTMWLPTRSMGRLSGVSQLSREVLRATGRPGAWQDYRDYYSGTYMSSWKGPDFHDFNLVQMGPDGRVSIFLSPMILLDELTIQSIPTNQLPDVSLYLNAIAGIPPEKRRGQVVIPELKVGSNAANDTPVVYIEFLTNCAADGSVRYAE